MGVGFEVVWWWCLCGGCVGRCGLCGGSVEMLKGDVGVVWEWC